MRILIIGASGSGTTTLGKAIFDEYNWSFFDADDYYWVPTDPPYQKKRNAPERLKMILNDLKTCTNAVVSGSIINWGMALEDSFDLIVFLYLDASLRVERLRKRELEQLGSVDPEFLRWASEYDSGPTEGRSLKRHRQWLAERKTKIVEIKGDLTVEERLKTISMILT